MKRILTMLLALAMMFSVAACGKKSNDGVNDKPVDVLTKVWETYKDDEKFAAGGGDANNMVMDGPGKYDVSDVEGLDAQLVLQVHDELIVESSVADSERAAALLREEMEAAAKEALACRTEAEVKEVVRRYLEN